MTKEKLTKKQADILAFVVGYVQDHGYAPSYREVGAHFGIASTATVHEHIKNLERKGYLSNDPDAARSIEVESSMLSAAKALLLPLKGLITAGQPIEAVETNETYPVPTDMINEGEDAYVLKVKGESMIEDGILSGDYVVVVGTTAPKDGDTVVALLENTNATLKRFYKEKGRVRLQPANRTMKPIYVKDIIVQGVVRGVIRDYRRMQ
ncbi:MAG TPA: transcriptional repressor LexA [Candidatus Binatia bacterium]|jgi:repressor LexA|nr:transcriptional repressor LexA [Candidatus Binatia bacterium]